ncbi:MAG: PaaI family thioesterase [Desulfobacterales bacterium]
MDHSKNTKKLPVRRNHMCFGCSPVNPSGLQMQFYVNKDSVISWLTVPAHLCGWANLVHGGVVTAILDEIMSWSALYFLKKVIVTRTISIEFIKQVYIQQELKAEGKVNRIISEKEVIMEGLIYNTKGEICTRSEGNFALLKPKIAKRLGVVDETVLKDLEPLINGPLPRSF